jgi:hypothetical protein
MNCMGICLWIYLPRIVEKVVRSQESGVRSQESGGETSVRS